MKPMIKVLAIATLCTTGFTLNAADLLDKNLPLYKKAAGVS